MHRLRPHISYANIVATLALIIAVGGASAFAATQLAKNSVGAKQLKKNAVTTAKVKKEAITAAKVKKGTLTGTQINVSTLGTVPSAQTAQTAQTANSIAAPEGWHQVSFTNGWGEVKLSLGVFPEPVAFYKDQGGVVHLRGEAISGTPGTGIFVLPPGYRPGNNRGIQEPASCFGPGCPKNVGSVIIYGPNTKFPLLDGVVKAPVEAEDVFLDGITFRAES